MLFHGWKKLKMATKPIHRFPRTHLSLTSPPSSPSSSSSSSSSDFEFTVSLSPTSKKPSHLCPADDLFYKGQLLPLHLSPRLDMVRTLLASSSSSSSSDMTASRDSADSASSFSADSSFSGDLLLLNDPHSSRPSSAAAEEDEDFKKQAKKHKYFSLSLFSSVFNRKSATAREVIKKYVKKVRPLYERLSAKNRPAPAALAPPPPTVRKCGRSSFSGNLNLIYYPRQRRGYVASCPSSMRSSPSHSGVLAGGLGFSESASSMEEVQSAIQGAIAHCKNSMAKFDLSEN